MSQFFVHRSDRRSPTGTYPHTNSRRRDKKIGGSPPHQTPKGLVWGFTLIELLVVIAIIGILASIVLANLNIARIKARDGRRISDVKQIQLTLELFYDANGYYPADIYAVTGSLSPTFISTVPKDPLGTGLLYNYQAINQTGGAVATCNATTNLCPSYHIGAVLGDSTNSNLQGDADNNIGFIGTNSVAEGTANGCAASTVAGPDTCFDVKQ